MKKLVLLIIGIMFVSCAMSETEYVDMRYQIDENEIVEWAYQIESSEIVNSGSIYDVTISTSVNFADKYIHIISIWFSDGVDSGYSKLSSNYKVNNNQLILQFNDDPTDYNIRVYYENVGSYYDE